MTDPLARLPENVGKKPLLLGEYVRADIDGRVLEQVFSIPRNALREGLQVWLATPDNKFETRTVTPLWRNADRVLIADDLAAGEKIIISDITAPIPGMDISTGGNDNPKKDAAQKTGTPAE